MSDCVLRLERFIYTGQQSTLQRQLRDNVSGNVAWRASRSEQLFVADHSSAIDKSGGENIRIGAATMPANHKPGALGWNYTSHTSLRLGGIR